jgi:hypothetical protein
MVVNGLMLIFYSLLGIHSMLLFVVQGNEPAVDLPVQGE